MRDLVTDLIPFALASAAAAIVIMIIPTPSGDIGHWLNMPSLLSLIIQLAAGSATAIATLALLRVPELPEALDYIKRKRQAF